MDGWNYRIMRHDEDESESHEGWFSIHEAYYDNDNIKGWTEQACNPGGETLQELKDDILRMLYAFDKPALDYSTKEEVAVDDVDRKDNQ